MESGWDEVDEPKADEGTVEVYEEGNRQVGTKYWEESGNNHKADVEVSESFFSDLPTN